MCFRIIKLYKPFCIRLNFLTLCFLTFEYSTHLTLILFCLKITKGILAFSATISSQISKKRDDQGLADLVNYGIISVELLHYSTPLPYLPLWSSFSVTCWTSPWWQSILHSPHSLSVKTRVASLNQVLEILSTRLCVVSELFSIIIVVWVSAVSPISTLLPARKWGKNHPIKYVV